jgi:hypothetical protein
MTENILNLNIPYNDFISFIQNTYWTKRLNKLIDIGRLFLNFANHIESRVRKNLYRNPIN